VPIQARHICILFRRFISYQEDMTRPYVEALEARGIPHLLVGGRSFHNRAEIEALRAALAAIEWPDDELSVFATLRGSLFAISDEELRIRAVRFGDTKRRARDRGGGAAAEGLEDERGAQLLVDLAILVARLEEEIAVGDREDLGDAGEPRRAQEGLLEKALPVGEADERLGMQLAGDRPKPGARTAAKDCWYQTH